MNFSKVCVIGLGYIGLPTASILATHGLRVIGVDVNLQVIKTLRDGKLHIQEPGLRTLVHAALGSGNLIVKDQPEEAEAFIIAVPTPFYDDKKADLRAVMSAARSVVPYLRQGNLVVLESTSPPRTTIDILAPILSETGLRPGIDYYLAYSPERVLPGQILRELIENARVIGGVDVTSAEAGRDLYATFALGDIVLTDSTTAEMVKLMENTYRDINIAIANEFARLADRFGVNIWEAISYANQHPRINILKPGPGVGGHCISVDPWFLVEAAPDLTSLISTARKVNDNQPNYVIEQLCKLSRGGLLGKRIAVLGLTYKADVDDIRESPAIEVIRLLIQAGAIVKAFDPKRLDLALPGIDTLKTLKATVEDAEIIMLLVGHNELIRISPNQMTELSPARIVFDGVGGWSSELWKQAGYRIYRLGDGKNKPDET